MIDSLQRLLLGTELRQRLTMLRTLTAAGVYAFCTLMQWQCVRVGFTERPGAVGFIAFMLLGVGAICIAIRSGFTRRFRDPALTMLQMAFAIVSLAFAYLINPQTRGMLLMVVALVLVFGAFSLSKQRCRDLGWLALAVFGATMLLAVEIDPRRFDSRIEALHFAFAAAVLPTIAYLAGELSQLRIDQHRQKHELRDAVARLNRLATHDELTGLPNRRHVQEWIGHEFARSRRSGADTCIAILDLDHFKRINDTLGHATGDAVLRTFSHEARRGLRDADVLARWGGEEFLCVMPDTALAEAQAALDRLRGHVALDASWRECPAARVTFSAGLTRCLPQQTLEQAVERADAALYQAKRQGRDRVLVA